LKGFKKMKNTKTTKTILRSSTMDVAKLKGKAVKKTKIKTVSPLLQPASYGVKNVENMRIISKGFFKKLNNFDTKIKSDEGSLGQSLVTMLETAKKNHIVVTMVDLKKAVYHFSNVTEKSSSTEMRIIRLCQKAVYCIAFEATINSDADVIGKDGKKVPYLDIKKAMQDMGVAKVRDVKGKNKTSTLVDTRSAIETLLKNSNLIKEVEISKLKALQTVIETNIKKLESESIEEANSHMIKVGTASVQLSKTAFA
jgi:hypothetical protein